MYNERHVLLGSAISADGMRIISGSSDESVRVWDTLTGAELKVFNRAAQFFELEHRVLEPLISRSAIHAPCRAMTGTRHIQRL